VPAVPVFPGEQVTWFSSDAEKKLFARTIDGLRWNGNNSAIMLAVARSRLSMPNRWQWLKSDPCRFIRQVHPIPSSRMKKSVYVCLTAMLLSIHPTGAETTEAAEAHDVVIRHNRFINCGYGEGNFNDASCIDVFSNSTTPLPGSNKRILIEDNLCDAPGGHAIVVDSDAQGRLPGD